MKHLLKDKTAPIGVDYVIVSYDSVNDKVIVKGGSEPTPPQPTYEYVDLGLSVKWATCNVGATKPEEYGKYFQWGDTVGYTDEAEVKAHSTWETAPFNNGSSTFDSTYFASVSGTVCPNGVLATEYDAATQNMGDGWRMPTQAECEELTANTTSEWVTNYNESDVNGIKFTASNGNYIFIPAAGGAINSSMDDGGSYGYVWSSTLRASYTYLAWGLYFNSSDQKMGSNGRYDGFSVRGVCE